MYLCFLRNAATYLIKEYILNRRPITQLTYRRSRMVYRRISCLHVCLLS